MAAPALSGAAGILSDDFPLWGVLSRVTRKDLLDTKGRRVRRYNGVFESVGMLGGRRDVATKSVGYAITCKDGLKQKVGDILLSGGRVVSQAFTLHESIHVELSAHIKKRIDVSPDLRRADFGGMMFILGATLAHYSVDGKISGPRMRGGKSLNMHAMLTRTEPIPMEGVVFIPTTAATLDAPATVFALVCAANGTGSSAVVDKLAVNPLNNAARITAYEDHDLAVGVLAGIRLLMAMYVLSGESATGALALIKGIHSVTSVVSSTDEGGYMREVLRTCSYGASYGGVFMEDSLAYRGIPVFKTGNVVGAQALVDTIALKSAACVAISDPMMVINNNVVVPSSFCVGDIAKAGAESKKPSTIESKMLRRRIADGATEFCNVFVKNIAALFSPVEGDTENAENMMSAMFYEAADAEVSRHIKSTNVAPFFWIEPTTLFKHRDGGRATASGAGIIVGTANKRDVRLFEDVRVLSDFGANQSAIVKMSTVRSTPALMHLYEHPLNGLSHYTIQEADPEDFNFVGGGMHGAAELGSSLEEAMLARKSLSSMMWKHGIDRVPRPSECVYTGGVLKMALEKCSTEVHGSGLVEVSNNHVFNFLEADQMLTQSAVGPGEVDVDGPGALTTNTRMSVSRAAHTLRVLSQRSAGLACQDVGSTAVVLRRPSMYFDNTTMEGVVNAPPTGEQSVMTPYDLDKGKNADGAPRALVVHDAPSKFRQPDGRPKGTGSAGGGSGSRKTEDADAGSKNVMWEEMPLASTLPSIGKMAAETEESVMAGASNVGTIREVLSGNQAADTTVPGIEIGETPSGHGGDGFPKD